MSQLPNLTVEFKKDLNEQEKIHAFERIKNLSGVISARFNTQAGIANVTYSGANDVEKTIRQMPEVAKVYSRHWH